MNGMPPMGRYNPVDWPRSSFLPTSMAIFTFCSYFGHEFKIYIFNVFENFLEQSLMLQNRMWEYSLREYLCLFLHFSNGCEGTHSSRTQYPPLKRLHSFGRHSNIVCSLWGMHFRYKYQSEYYFNWKNSIRKYYQNANWSSTLSSTTERCF